MVLHIAHNDKNVGSNPTKLKKFKLLKIIKPFIIVKVNFLQKASVLYCIILFIKKFRYNM